MNNEEAVELANKLKKKKYTIDAGNFDLGYFTYGDKGYEQKYRMKMGLPFEYYNYVPNWEGRLLGFGLCWEVFF